MYTAVLNAANPLAGIGWLAMVWLQTYQGLTLGIIEPLHFHLDPKMRAEAAARGRLTNIDIDSVDSG